LLRSISGVRIPQPRTGTIVGNTLTDDEVRMRWVRWTTLAWPGLTQLWFSGTAWGLSVGCSFAWLACFAVLSTFVWTELVGPWLRIGVWVLLLLVWTLSLGLSFRQLLFSDPGREASRADTLFRKAQREYLNGNWIGAEQLLVELIDANPNDIDAQLLLASVLRRTGQLTEAAGQLRHLEANDEAEKWRNEIDRERKLLDELFHPANTHPIDDSQISSPTEQEPIAENRAA
jgi:hypothetical protein